MESICIEKRWNVKIDCSIGDGETSSEGQHSLVNNCQLEIIDFYQISENDRRRVC